MLSLSSPLRCVPALCAAVTVSLMLPAPAAASRIIECGNYGWRDSTGTVGWGMSPVDGAGLFNLTTRRVSCRKARRFARRYRQGSFVPGWRCTENLAYEYGDYRCTASRGRVIRWQLGA